MGFSEKKHCTAILLFILLSNYIIESSCSCTLNLTAVDIQSAESPLILKPPNQFAYPEPKNDLEFLYPTYTDNKCLVSNMFGGMQNSLVLNLACPGNSLQLPNISNAIIQSTYLIREDRQYPDYDLVIPEVPESFPPSHLDSSPIKCSDAIKPTMKKLKENTYAIGIQVSVLDFIPIISLYYNNEINMVCAHVDMLSIIERRPKIAEDTKFSQGLLYNKASSDQLDHLYTKEYQIEQLSNKLPKNIIDNYMKDNYFVKGQLISKDDLFYIPQQRSTFFYENTVPIWKSINDGNWKKVGDIIRKIAHQSVKDFDVYSGAFGVSNSKLDGTTYHFNITNDVSNKVPNLFVPEILFKIINDRKKEGHSIVFLTVNDPHVRVDSEGKIENENLACCDKSECPSMYPEFMEPEKGYTCCCSLTEFPIWNKLRNLLINPPSFGYNIPPPPPPLHFPHPAPMPLSARPY